MSGLCEGYQEDAKTKSAAEYRPTLPFEVAEVREKHRAAERPCACYPHHPGEAARAEMKNVASEDWDHRNVRGAE